MPIEEKIRTYIDNTTFPSDTFDRYDIGIKELNCLRQLTLKTGLKAWFLHTISAWQKAFAWQGGTRNE